MHYQGYYKTVGDLESYLITLSASSASNMIRETSCNSVFLLHLAISRQMKIILPSFSPRQELLRAYGLQSIDFLKISYIPERHSHGTAFTIHISSAHEHKN